MSELVVACYEAPGWGGGATSAFDLFRALRDRGVDASFLSILPADRAPGLRRVFGDRVGEGALRDPDVELVAVRDRRGTDPALRAVLRRRRPAAVLAIGWSASLHVKRAAPEAIVVLYTTGCHRVKVALRSGAARDAVHYARRLAAGEDLPASPAYDEAVRGADLVIAHSGVVREILGRAYPEVAGKLHPQPLWFAGWIVAGPAARADLRRPFARRRIDVLFVASDWTRIEKNYPLVRRLAAARPGAAVHVVGEAPEPVPGAVHHGLVRDPVALLRLMGDARVLVSPSLFDAAPGVLFEAATMGSNVVASRNCGNWRLCHPDLVAEPPTAAAFEARIALALRRPFRPNFGGFRVRSGVDDLLEALPGRAVRRAAPAEATRPGAGRFAGGAA